MSAPTLPRAAVLDAAGIGAQLFRALDNHVPRLPEPERSAALQIRTEVADIVRRLNNLGACLAERGVDG